MSYFEKSQSSLERTLASIQSIGSSFSYSFHLGSAGIVHQLSETLAIKVGRTLCQHEQMLKDIPDNFKFLDYLYNNFPNMRIYLPRFYGLIGTVNGKFLLAMENYGVCENLTADDLRVSKLRTLLKENGFKMDLHLGFERTLFQKQSGEVKIGDLDGIGIVLPQDIKNSSLAPPTILANRSIFDSFIPLS